VPDGLGQTAVTANELTSMTVHGLDKSGSSRPALHKVAPVVVVSVYFFLDAIVFWPVHRGASHRLLGSDWDFTQSVWFLSWVPHALAHGLNPFFSKAMLVPTGVNLAQNTASPLLGLITAPLAPLLSPVARANLLLVMAMPVSASAAFVVLRKWKIWIPVAALGGLIYGFSPYMVGQSRDHIELVFVPLPPLIALSIASILQRRGSTRRLGIQLGLLVTAQYLISPEITAIVAIFAFGAVTFAGVRRGRAMASERARFVSRSALIAAAAVAVLLAYPTWMLIDGPQHFTGSTWPTVNPYHNDLLSFVVPGPLQKVPFGMRGIGSHLDTLNGPTEAGGYIGIPTLLIVCTLAWWARRSFRMQMAVLLFLSAAILSLGPYLVVNRRDTHLPLPFLLFNHVPLLNDILPSRICFAEGALLAAVISFGLDDIRRACIGGQRSVPSWAHWNRRRLRIAIACVTLALVVTMLPEPREPGVNQDNQSVALPARIQRAIPAGQPVTITYPYATEFTMQPMLWQTQVSFRFRLLGGYAYHPDPRGRPTLQPNIMHPSSLQRFLVGQEVLSAYGLERVYGHPLPLGPLLVASTQRTLSEYKVQMVIVDTSVGGGGPVMELFDHVLGPPLISSGHYHLWIDGRLTPTRR
jgi:hypothetical protein